MKMVVQTDYKDTALEWLFAIDGIFSMNPYLLWPDYSYNAFFDMAKKIVELIILSLFIINKSKKINKSQFFMAIS